MKHVYLGHTQEKVGAIAYGCWRFAESTIEAADRKIRTALDAGLTLIDTADIYGLGEASGFGGAEKILGDVLQGSPNLRGEMFLATKGGIDAVRPYDSSYDYLIAAMDKSLSRLKTDYVDLYQIHRPDITMPMSETARGLNEMLEKGKTRYVGVSNFTPEQTRALQAHVNAPLLTTQPEFSAICQTPITDGTFDLCMEKDMTALVWSPLAGGQLVSGRMPSPDAPEHAAVLEVLDRFAKTYETDRDIIALAFTLSHGADVIPIIGTQTPERIKRAVKATEIPFSGRDFYDVVEAFRGEKMP